MSNIITEEPTSMPARRQQVEVVEERTKARNAKQVLLLGAGFNTNNMGVWALASSAIKAASHGIPGAKVRLLDYHTEPVCYDVNVGERTLPIELVNIRFSKKLHLSNNIARLILIALLLRLLPSRKLRRRVIDGNPVLMAINDASYIGSIAGGDSFSDIYGMTRLLYVGLPQLLVILLRKPLVLLPQTLGPFKSLFAKRIGKYIIKRAAVVNARDEESLRVGQSLVGGKANHLRLCPDMAFALDTSALVGKQKSQVDQLRSQRPLIGFNVSGLLYMGGYTNKNMFGLKGDYKSLVHNIIDFFVDTGAHVLLVPHVLGSTQNAESDISAIEKVYAKSSAAATGHLHKLDGEFDHQQIKTVIGQCDFFLGSRMHACIGSLSQCIPAIGLSYSRKFLGVFESVGTPHLVVDLRSLTDEEVIAQIRSNYALLESDRATLEARVPAIQSEVMGLFSEV